MIRLFLGIALALCLTNAAQAGHRHGNPATQPPPSNCAFPVDGGCAAAGTNNSFTQANFATFSTSNSGGNVGSGQTWTAAHPWNWNSPGIDPGYTVGYSLAQPLVDPVTASSSGQGSWGVLPAGCAYQPATAAYKRIFCAAISTDITIEGFNFVSASLNDCVKLEIAVNVTGGHTIHILNDNFGYGPQAQSNCDLSLNQSFVNVEGGTDTVDSEFYVINGQSPSGYSFQQVAMFQNAATGPWINKYFAALHSPQRPFGYGGGVNGAGSVDFENFYVDGLVELCTACTGGGEHAEIVETNALTQTYKNFVILTPAPQAATGTAPIYLSAGQPSVGQGLNGDVENFVIVTNKSTNASTPGASIMSAAPVELAYMVYNNVTIGPGYVDLTGTSGACNSNVGGTAGQIAGNLNAGQLTITSFQANSFVGFGADAAGQSTGIVNVSGTRVTNGTLITGQVSGVANGIGVYSVTGSQTLTLVSGSPGNLALTTPSPINGALSTSGIISLTTGNAVGYNKTVGQTGCL